MSSYADMNIFFYFGNFGTYKCRYKPTLAILEKFFNPFLEVFCVVLAPNLFENVGYFRHWQIKKAIFEIIFSWQIS